MSVLIIGESETATHLVQLLEARRQPVQRCRTVATAVEVLDLAGSVYWLIMVDAADEAMDRLLAHLRAIGSDTPVATVGSPDEHPTTHPWCRVERWADGTQSIRYGAQAAPLEPAGRARALADQPVAFAYNAPCSRVG